MSADQLIGRRFEHEDAVPQFAEALVHLEQLEKEFEQRLSEVLERLKLGDAFALSIPTKKLGRYANLFRDKVVEMLNDNKMKGAIVVDNGRGYSINLPKNQPESLQFLLQNLHYKCDILVNMSNYLQGDESLDDIDSRTRKEEILKMLQDDGALTEAMRPRISVGTASWNTAEITKERPFPFSESQLADSLVTEMGVDGAAQLEAKDMNLSFAICDCDEGVQVEVELQMNDNIVTGTFMVNRESGEMLSKVIEATFDLEEERSKRYLEMLDPKNSLPYVAWNSALKE